MQGTCLNQRWLLEMRHPAWNWSSLGQQSVWLDGIHPRFRQCRRCSDVGSSRSGARLMMSRVLVAALMIGLPGLGAVGVVFWIFSTMGFRGSNSIWPWILLLQPLAYLVALVTWRGTRRDGTGWLAFCAAGALVATTVATFGLLLLIARTA